MALRNAFELMATETTLQEILDILRTLSPSGGLGHFFRGEATIAKDAIGTVISEVVSDYRIMGFSVNGDADALCQVLLNGEILFQDSISIIRRTAGAGPFIPESVTGVLELKVANTGKGTGTYFGVILGDEAPAP